MSPKRSKGPKSILSRQQIAERRKSLKEKKLGTDSAARRALGGVFVGALSLLSLLAVATFDAHDRVGPGFRNAVGPVGHGMAEGLRGLLGHCAYVLPLSGLYASALVCLGDRRRRWPQVLSLALLSISGAVLCQLVLSDEKGLSHPPGGWVGQALGQTLSSLFSTVGTVVLVTAVCVCALIVGTQYVFLRFCSWAWQGVVIATERGRVAALVLWERQKEAFAAQREARARAKLEEAAFLAQLEADEEELLAAEQRASEAELKALEAERVAREREQKKTAMAAPRRLERGARPGAPAALGAGATALPAPGEGARGRGLPEFGGEPAWASTLGGLPAETPAAVQAAAPGATAVGETGGRKRRVPNIVTAPAASLQEQQAQAAADMAEAGAAAQLAGASAAQRGAPESGDAAATGGKALPAPGASPAGALATGPQTPQQALARIPVIVEPKPPPKPTTKRPAEQFQFVGDRKSFELPPMDLLAPNQQQRSALDKDVYLQTAEKLRAKLADFNIQGEVVEIRPGPVVTMYEFLPAPGIKVSKIASLQDDLAMAMEALAVRIVAPIPGKNVVGIEVPNRDREMVLLREIGEQDTFNKSPSKLTMCVGKDIEGMPYVLDLAKAPHLLIAGTTGSGKSVAVNSMIMSILLKSTPEEVRFIMVDPKMLELSIYDGIPHLLLPVVTDPKKAALALRWAVEEMERRYALLSEAGVRNIAGYNKLVENAAGEVKGLLKSQSQESAHAKKAEPAPKKKLVIVDVGEGESEEEALARAKGTDGEPGVPAPKDAPEDVREAVVGTDETTEKNVLAPDPAADAEAEAAVAAATAESEEPPKKELTKLPYIVVIIDELADLMMVASREVEMYIARLAQMARAAGIHLMVATQRPSTDVVTGVIKANFPTRISFMLRSKPDSMTILGTVGAEALLGMGDMLILPPTSSNLQRVHGAYVSEEEIGKVVSHLKAQGKPVYDDSILKPREEDAEEGGGGEDDLSDELYDQALAVVGEMKQVSISMLQRKMRIGYNRAARMIERMERDGVVGPADGARPREVLIRAVGDMPGAGAM